MSCPSGGRLSTSSRSIWAFCTACMLVLMVPIRACWAELYVFKNVLKKAITKKCSEMMPSIAASHQGRHVAAVHLTHGDLLLSGRHGAHAERLGADGAGADHPRQRHRAVLHAAHAVKLLLQDGGPLERKQHSGREETPREARSSTSDTFLLASMRTQGALAGGEDRSCC